MTVQMSLDGTALEPRHECGRCGGSRPVTEVRIRWENARFRAIAVDCGCGHRWQETHRIAGDEQEAA